MGQVFIFISFFAVFISLAICLIKYLKLNPIAIAIIGIELTIIGMNTNIEFEFLAGVGFILAISAAIIIIKKQ